MNELQKFITFYLDDYVKMAYRQLTHKVDINKESQLVNNLYNLLDEYKEGELEDYIYNNKII